MKKLLAVIMASLFLLALCACGNKPAGEFDREGYKVLLDNALKLPSDFSEELLGKVMHPGELKYRSDYYKENKDESFVAAVEDQFNEIARTYAENYGDDWKLSYTITKTDEKDEQGVENYKSFDNHYFTTYGIDTDKIQAVTFVYAKVHIEGSKGSNDKDKTIQCFCVDGVWYSFYAPQFSLKL